ncbi:MAG: glycosyltransferase family 2 protein [Candidatus Pacebacteria bacterium]|nr:glycosyltransferase family 2 protein [Candidatus Paceibacterota bacterium]
MKSKIPLSVIIIYNSKADNLFLSKTKQSVQEFEEVILFDAGSEPIKDFAQVRNTSIKKAKNDYVMFIDSDEVLEQSSISEIKKFVEEKKYDLISIVRTDVFMGKELKYGEAGAIHLVRLGKKDKLKYNREVHETAIVKPNYLLTGSSIKLIHYSHVSLSSFISKVSRYAYLESRLRTQKPSLGLLVELLFFPPLKFLYNYLIKQGYRDGVRGFIYAVIMSLHSLFVRVNIFEKHFNKIHNKSSL